MKRILTIAFALSLVATGAFAQTYDYGWSLSGSMTDPGVNTGPVQPVSTVYLWLTCTGSFGGWAAMEADLEFPAGWQNFGFNPLNGVLNAGTASALLLAVGGCPTEPFLCGSWSLFDAAATGGSVCLVPSAANGYNVTVDCDPLNATTHDNAHVGYFAGTGTPCQVNNGDCTVSVEDASWGSIKGLYR
jgi:hypothetical protein